MRRRGPTNDEVIVSAGLDLLEAEPLDQAVEGREELVERADERVRGRTDGLAREADGVGEEDGHVVDGLRDPGAAGFLSRGLEPLDDRLWQDVEQQRVGPLALRIELPLAQEEEARRPVQPVRRDEAQDPEGDQVERGDGRRGRAQTLRAHADEHVHENEQRGRAATEEEGQPKQREAERHDQDHAHVAVVSRHGTDDRYITDPGDPCKEQQDG